MSIFNTEQKNYALYGALFGCCFPIVATVIECTVQGVAISPGNLLDVQANSPLLWIIDTAPLFLGLFASFGGAQLDKVTQKNAQLAQSNTILADLADEAQSANKAKTEFLTNMSHEIRSPMNAIIGLTYLLQKSELSEDQRSHLSSVKNSADSLLRIINDILDFSKVEAGKLVVEQAAFSPEMVLSTVIDQVNIKLSKKPDVEFQVKFDSTVPHRVVGDSVRFQQVVNNLLDNAVKFTSKGEIVLTVGAIEREGGYQLVVTVDDQGIGMTEEQVHRLFQPFTQADYSTTRKYGGTGLGLSISKNLVELMGGTITVESTPNIGSRFRFTVDVGAEVSAEAIAQRFKEIHKKVLIVDDSVTSRAILSDMLQNFGFSVVLASSGQEARDRYAESVHDDDPFELLLVDWKMPTMDGLETIRRINNEFPNEAPTIIMVTAYGKEEVLDAAMGMDIDSFLVKPVNPSLMYDTLVNVFSDHVLKRSTLQAAVATSFERDAIKGLNVLLVEDNEINQKVALELLKLVGINAQVASNGQIALDKMQQDVFDIVLMDIQMPVLDGLSAARELRSRGYTTPIIAMTAHAFVGEREKSINAGMNDHLTKPVNPDSLYKTIYQYCIGGNATPVGIPSQTATSLPSDISSLAKTIDGFNAQRAFERCGNNADLLRSLLLQFCDQQAHTPSQIHDKSIDTQTLIASVHNVKGVSANLGLESLSASALAAEEALKNDADNNHDPLVSLSDLLSATIVSIQNTIKSPLPSIETTKGNQPTIESVIGLLERGESATEQLKSLLANATTANKPTLERALQHAMAWEPADAIVLLRRVHEHNH